jgi:hypothetical protein
MRNRSFRIDVHFLFYALGKVPSLRHPQPPLVIGGYYMMAWKTRCPCQNPEHCHSDQTVE